MRKLLFLFLIFFLISTASATVREQDSGNIQVTETYSGWGTVYFAEWGDGGTSVMLNITTPWGDFHESEIFTDGELKIYSESGDSNENYSIEIIEIFYGGETAWVEVREYWDSYYYVKTNGNDASDGKTLSTAWATIDKAFSTVTQGQTAIISAGNYGHEHIIIDNSGTASEPITIKTDGGEVIIDGVDDAGIGIKADHFLSYKEYINIDGITIKNYSNPIYFYKNRFINFDNMVFESNIGPVNLQSSNNINFDSINVSGYYVFYMTSTSSVSITNSNFLTSIRVITSASSNNYIYDNFFKNPTLVYEIQSGSAANFNYSGQGNYWTGYTGNDSTNDGIGDDSYSPDPDMTDYFPQLLRISGYVTDTNSEPIESAIITIDGTLLSNTSNATGYYFLSFPIGSHTVNATKSGLNYSTANFTNQWIDTTQNFTLNYSAPTPTLTNITSTSTENSIWIRWDASAQTDEVWIYRDTIDNLHEIETAELFIDLNLDSGTTYEYWLEPWDSSINGTKYYLSDTTDTPTPTATSTPSTGTGGGYVPTPTPTPNATVGPTPMPPVPETAEIFDAVDEIIEHFVFTPTNWIFVIFAYVGAFFGILFSKENPEENLGIDVIFFGTVGWIATLILNFLAFFIDYSLLFFGNQWLMALIFLIVGATVALIPEILKNYDNPRMDGRT